MVVPTAIVIETIVNGLVIGSRLPSSDWLVTARAFIGTNREALLQNCL
jgi:hypothetical protein